MTVRVRTDADGLLLVRNCRIADLSSPVDIAVEGGSIREIAPAGTLDSTDAEMIDGSKYLVTPGLVDAHLHLDKTLYGRQAPRVERRGSLRERMATRSLRADLGIPDEESIGALLSAAGEQGTVLLRTHTDVDEEGGLSALGVVSRVARAVAPGMIVQQVAFPQYGLVGSPHTQELLYDAHAHGAHRIGGIDPAGVDNDPKRHLEIVFDAAATTGLGVDIHLHDRGTLGIWQIHLIGQMVRHFSLDGRVDISHAFCLADVDDGARAASLEVLQAHDIGVITAIPYDTPVLPLSEIREREIRLAVGNDNVRDLWSPYGNGSMIHRAGVLAVRSNFRHRTEISEVFSLISESGARALGVGAWGIAAGNRANMCFFEAKDTADVIARGVSPEIVMRAMNHNTDT